MKDDELKQITRAFQESMAKHAEVINTLTTNQKVLVSKIDELEKRAEVATRVEDIIKEVKAKTTETTPPATPPAQPAEPATPPAEPAPATPPPAEPAKKEGE